MPHDRSNGEFGGTETSKIDYGTCNQSDMRMIDLLRTHEKEKLLEKLFGVAAGGGALTA